MSFQPPRSSGRGVRAQARRENIERSVSGRRIVAEAEREEALREGRPLRRGLWQRLLGVFGRGDA